MEPQEQQLQQITLPAHKVDTFDDGSKAEFRSFLYPNTNVPGVSIHIESPYGRLRLSTGEDIGEQTLGNIVQAYFGALEQGSSRQVYETVAGIAKESFLHPDAGIYWEDALSGCELPSAPRSVFTKEELDELREPVGIYSKEELNKMRGPVVETGQLVEALHQGCHAAYEGLTEFVDAKSNRSLVAHKIAPKLHEAAEVLHGVVDFLEFCDENLPKESEEREVNTSVLNQVESFAAELTKLYVTLRERGELGHQEFVRQTANSQGLGFNSLLMPATEQPAVASEERLIQPADASDSPQGEPIAKPLNLFDPLEWEPTVHGAVDIRVNLRQVVRNVTPYIEEVTETLNSM